ncbi:hypothetical protein MKW98_001676 [Papaver atlanticum]|uniref:Uncharacterized protein n=1 Tax=Papaver atlanticum TaxID=357466 RepID=A0AAD4XA41_9MAGN|nr:hypothetical protein MKW98_001676 [Papaver atlanticum]
MDLVGKSDDKVKRGSTTYGFEEGEIVSLDGGAFQAVHSGGKIQLSARDHATLMEILDRRLLKLALPTVARPIMSLEASEDAVAGGVKHSLI